MILVHCPYQPSQSKFTKKILRIFKIFRYEYVSKIFLRPLEDTLTADSSPRHAPPRPAPPAFGAGCCFIYVACIPPCITITTALPSSVCIACFNSAVL